MKSHLLLIVCLPLVSLASPPGSPMTAGRGASAKNGTGPNLACAPAGNGMTAPQSCGANRLNAKTACGGRGVICLSVPPGTVTTLPAAEMVAAIEQERVANDLYAGATQWNLRVFSRTALAEDRHESALVRLAGTADIAVPAAQPGVYGTADVQTLYNSIRPLMSESAASALRGGAFVEETVIVELRRLLSGAPDEGTKVVLTNLEHASQHHLIAFVRNLSARGETYVPQVLSAADYQAIIDLEV